MAAVVPAKEQRQQLPAYDALSLPSAEALEAERPVIAKVRNATKIIHNPGAASSSVTDPALTDTLGPGASLMSGTLGPGTHMATMGYMQPGPQFAGRHPGAGSWRAEI